MDHRQPLLSAEKLSFFSDDEWKFQKSETRDKAVVDQDMGLVVSRGSNRIADLSWSFPSLTMEEVTNLKKTYETLSMLSPRDNLISKATFMHYFKLGRFIGGRFFTVLDKDRDGKINLTEFLGGLAICLHGSFQEKSGLLFKMFDIDDDDRISEEDIAAILPSVLRASNRDDFYTGGVSASKFNKAATTELDDQPGNIISNLFARYDKSQTGAITLDNFCEWIQGYPRFVDVVFQCDFFINFMSTKSSEIEQYDVKETHSHPSLQSQTWMEEEMEVEKILEVSRMMHLSNARFLWKPCFPKTASAKVPATRFKHTTVLYKGCIYLLGGRGKQNTFKDLWKYYIDDNTWEKIQVEGPGPPALQEHSAVLHGRCMYVFGGVVASDATIPLWCLDLESLRWKKLPANKTGPKNRRGHSASVYYDSMYVFGGLIDPRGATNELWRYDLETNGWALIKPQHSRSEIIPPRYSHASAIYNNALWIFGGFEGLERRSELWRWDFELSFWNKVKFRQGPPPLTGHCMVKASGNVIIFGGEDNSGLNNQLWRYSFETYKWTKLNPYGGISPPVRSYHTMIVLSPFMTYGIPSQNTITQEKTADDYFVRKNSGSKRSFGSKSNSADNILCTERESKPVVPFAGNSKPRNYTRPRSVIEQMCDNLQDMEALTPVEVAKSNTSTCLPSLDSIKNTLASTESETNSDRRGMFQVGGNDTEMVDENIYYSHRQGWSLLLIGGKGKMSVEMHKTSLDVWQCDIGEASDIPPVNEPEATSWHTTKDLFSKKPGDVTYRRFDSPPSPPKSSKRKLQSYDLLEVTDISDDVCFESSPEQKPKLQENRRLLQK